MNRPRITVPIETVVDQKRGCGWRKPGGLYLRADGLRNASCGKLPFKLTICPCCGNGIKHKIGYQWFGPKALFAYNPCMDRPGLGSRSCSTCPLGSPPEKAGLIWIGRAFYKTTSEYTEEAARLGISRRIHNIPKGFKVGETWVFVAHKDCIEETCPDCRGEGQIVGAEGSEELISKCKTCKATGKTKSPGIFHAFLPNKVEYVVRGKESKKFLLSLIEKGITLVRVTRAE